MLFYVPVIILVARLFGVRQSGMAAVLSFLALDLVFIPPYYHLNVADVPEWIGLIVFLLVALVAGQQTGRLRERERVALQRQAELELLNSLSFRIAAEKSVRSTADFIADEVTGVLGAERAALYAGATEHRHADVPRRGGRRQVVFRGGALVSWVLRTGKAIGSPAASALRSGTRLDSVDPADAIPGVVADGNYVPLLTGDSLEGVLYARLAATALSAGRPASSCRDRQPCRSRVRAPAPGRRGRARRRARRDGPDEDDTRVVAVPRAQDTTRRGDREGHRAAR